MLQSALPIEADDSLVFQVYSSVASLVVLFSGLHMDARGETKYWEREVRPTSDRLITEASTVVGKCFLISASATLRSGNANRGQCYVRAFIRRGSGSNAIPVYQLLQGYCADAYAPCYPLGRMEGPLEGPGYMRAFEGTNPAAGAEWSETVPTGARWRIYSVSARLVTDANAGNRRPIVNIQSSTLTLLFMYKAADSMDHIANTTADHQYAPTGYASPTGAGIPFAPLPETTMLAAGWTITVISTGLKVGDNYGAPQMAVEEWLEA